MRLDEIETKKYYHVTPTENESTIFREGLKPMMGDRSDVIGEPYDTIYLFTSKEAMDNALMNWLGEEFDEDEALTILEVMVPDRNLIVDQGVGYEVEYHGVIPPENIRVVYRDYGSKVEHIRKDW